jgi:acyl-coenzyme A thioesterase 9
MRVPPTALEAEELHALFLKYGQLDDAYVPAVTQGSERVWMSDTRLEKCILMFPQERKSVRSIYWQCVFELTCLLVFTKKYLEVNVLCIYNPYFSKSI